MTTLDQDAIAIRTLQEKGKKIMFQIAERLAKVQEREGWSTTELAEWCGEEDLGYETQASVVRMLNWHRGLVELQQAKVIPAGITPAEGRLRPFTQACTQGLLETIDEKAEVYRAIEDLPTNEVEEAVYNHPIIRKKERQAERQRAARPQRASAPALVYDDEDPDNATLDCEEGIRELVGGMSSVIELHWHLVPDGEFHRIMDEWADWCAKFYNQIQTKRKR